MCMGVVSPFVQSISGFVSAVDTFTCVISGVDGSIVIYVVNMIFYTYRNSSTMVAVGILTSEIISSAGKVKSKGIYI